jgi:hypothetical protein
MSSPNPSRPRRTLLLRIVALSAGTTLSACGGEARTTPAYEGVGADAGIPPDGGEPADAILQGTTDSAFPDHFVVGVVDAATPDGNPCCGLVANPPDGGDAQIINGTLPITPDSGAPDIILGSVVNPPDAMTACDPDAMILGDAVCAPDAGVAG